MWKIITTTLSEIIFSHLNLKYAPKKHSLNEEEKSMIRYKNKKWSFLYIAKIGYYFNIFFILLVPSSKPFYFFHFGVPTIICQDQLLQYLLHSSLAVPNPSTFAASTLLDVAFRSCNQILWHAWHQPVTRHVLKCFISCPRGEPKEGEKKPQLIKEYKNTCAQIKVGIGG